MADVRIEGEVIVGEVEIAAGPEAVFRALTEPERLRSWWGSKETYRIEEWRSELRPGGAWESRGIDSTGGPFSVHGVFLAIEPPRRLVYTWNPSWAEGPETTVSYELVPTDHGTLVRVRHDGFGSADAFRKSHLEGWPAVLGWLRTHAENTVTT